MEGLVRGDVVVVDVEFSNASDSKRRPAMVAAVTEMNDLIVCAITSKARKGPYRVPVEACDFATGSLPQPSSVRADFLMTISRGRVHHRTGHLSSGPVETEG